jgi:hypothetical protein
MLVLSRISYFQSRHDDLVNVAFARELAITKDKDGIHEVANELWNKDLAVANACIRVINEIAAINPSLIADHADDFLKLIQSNNKDMVWGAMIALAAIAPLKADVIYEQITAVQSAMLNGSVNVAHHGVKVLSQVAASSKTRNAKVFPLLLNHLATCWARAVPQHSKNTLIAVNTGNQEEFVNILKRRLPELSASQAARVRLVIKEAGARAEQ